MKKLHRILIIFLVSVNFTYCINNARNQNKNSFHDVPIQKEIKIPKDTRERIDSLLSTNYSKNNSITDLSEVSNLDKANGFRGLKFGMSYDNINFLGNENVYNLYNQKGWYVVTIHTDYASNIRFIQPEDEMHLTFFKNSLSKIEISSSGTYFDLSVTDPSSGPLKLLYSLYGYPNLTNVKKLEKNIGGEFRKAWAANNRERAQNLMLFDNSKYFDELICSWQSEKVLLTYSGRRFYYYENSNNSSNPLKIITANGCHFAFESIRDKLTIDYQIKLMEDSIQEEKDKEYKKNLFNMF